MNGVLRLPAVRARPCLRVDHLQEVTQKSVLIDSESVRARMTCEDDFALANLERMKTTDRYDIPASLSCPPGRQSSI